MKETISQVTWEDYTRAERFLPWNAIKLVFNTQVLPSWIENGDMFWYLRYTRNGKEFVLVDAERKMREQAFDHIRLAAALSLATHKLYERNKLPFDTFKFIEGGRALKFNVEEKCWICDLKMYRCIEAEKEEMIALWELPSPNCRWAAFAKDNNLYIRSVDTGEEIMCTNDGEPYNKYAASAESNLKAVTQRLSGKPSPPVAIWSPDSKKLLTQKLDERKVNDMYLIQSVPQDGSVRPVLHSYRYPLPGDRDVPLSKLVILNVEKQTKLDVKYEAQPVTSSRSPIENNEVWWSEDSKHVYFIYRERGDKALHLCEVEASTGATRTIVKEFGSTHIEPHLTRWSRPNVRVLGGGREVIWFSQRNGWAHLYLYDGKSGELKHQITNGPWVVRDIVHIDEDYRLVYFTAGGKEEGRDPYYRHLYRVGFDGENLQLLTTEDANHEINFSPNGNYFVDTYSRVDTPPISVLRAADGQLVCKLEESDVEMLLATGWQWPERFKVKARDGVTDVYGVIYHPSNFDSSKKYPILDAIYPGPQVIHTPKSFPQDPYPPYLSFWEPQAIAELGFIVVIVDGLGTPLRSKAFHDWSYGNLGETGGLQDHITAIQQLADKHAYMDLNRVGIYGHSGGGNASVRAVLLYPDFFKVAVSSAGNHDQRGYLAGWGEKYQGLLDGKNYLNQVNASLAESLEGKLLLIYGDMDDNVQPALTIQLVDAFIKANKDFDLLVLPNHNHMFMTDPYFIRRKWDYFVQYLLGQIPPKGYKIQAPDQEFMKLLEC